MQEIFITMSEHDYCNHGFMIAFLWRYRNICPNRSKVQFARIALISRIREA